jgi:hypothetical protein
MLEPENKETQDKSDKESKIQEQLEGISKKLDESSSLQQLLADPAVQAVLEARKRGTEIKVEEVRKEDEDEDEDDKVRPDLNEMSNVEVVTHMATKVFPKALKKIMKPMEDRLAQLEGVIEGQSKDTVEKQVAEARTKHEDFNDYTKSISEIFKANPDLTIEESYVIAKNRVLAGAPPKKKVSTEKPTGTAGKPGVTKQEPIRGRAGLESAIRDAMNESA